MPAKKEITLFRKFGDEELDLSQSSNKTSENVYRYLSKEKNAKLKWKR